MFFQGAGIKPSAFVPKGAACTTEPSRHHNLYTEHNCTAKVAPWQSFDPPNCDLQTHRWHVSSCGNGGVWEQVKMCWKHF